MRLSKPWGTFVLSILAIGLITGCQGERPDQEADAASFVSEYIPADKPGKFNEYWYQGKAELTSYQLEQARYGEIHPGEAVLIFVTEDFSRKKLVKLNNPAANDNDLSKVLKLNFTKKFNTGLYPYSMMASIFTPVDLTREPHSLKTTMSSQEWCGHTFTQLNLRFNQYEVTGMSYFEEEGEESFKLNKALLEDELWTRIRIDPRQLPLGEINIIPGSFYTRLRHIPLKVEQAQADLEQAESGEMKYSLYYPAHDRRLIIWFQTEFPYEISGWEETYKSGFGPSALPLTTRATLNKRLITDYWTRNSLADAEWRNKLGLKP